MSVAETRILQLLKEQPSVPYHKIADRLNQDAFKTAAGGKWSSREVSAFALSQGIRRHSEHKHTKGKKADLSQRQREEFRATVDLIIQSSLPKNVKLKALDVFILE